MIRVAYLGEFGLGEPQRVYAELNNIVEQNDKIELLTTMASYNLDSEFATYILETINSLKQKYPNKEISIVRASIQLNEKYHISEFDKVLYPIPQSDKPFYQRERALKAWLFTKEELPDIVISNYYKLLNLTGINDLKRFERLGVKVINVGDEKTAKKIYLASQQLSPNHAQAFRLLSQNKPVNHIAREINVTPNHVYAIFRKGKWQINRKVFPRKELL